MELHEKPPAHADGAEKNYSELKKGGLENVLARVPKELLEKIIKGETNFAEVGKIMHNEVRPDKENCSNLELLAGLGWGEFRHAVWSSAAEPERYYLKAMNCPHHHRIFAAEPRSYRDLPLRLAEYGTCYRYEQSGELFGLMRVRSLNMNDAHIYCTPEQFASEFNAVNEMYLKYFN